MPTILFGTTYTKEQDEFLLQFKDTNIKYIEIARLFNERFNDNRQKGAICSHCKYLGFAQRGTTRTLFSKEQDEFIRQNQYGISRQELSDKFNEKYGTQKTASDMKNHCQFLGLKNGMSGRFDTKSSHWQKGLTKEEIFSHYKEGYFEELCKRLPESNRKMKVGDIYLDHRQYARIVLSVEPNINITERTMPYARYLWEQVYGKDGNNENFIFLFADNDYKNTDISNILRVSRADNMLININGLKGKSELTKAYLEILDFEKAYKEGLK